MWGVGRTATDTHGCVPTHVHQHQSCFGLVCGPLNFLKFPYGQRLGSLKLPYLSKGHALNFLMTDEARAGMDGLSQIERSGVGETWGSCRAWAERVVGFGWVEGRTGVP